MPPNLIALIVVLTCAVLALYIGGQLVEPFISRREFLAWRIAWFAATIAAFLSEEFFVYAAVVVIICLYARSVGAASTGLFFLLLFAAPQIDIPISGFGFVNQLFPVNNGRLLSITLLLPILFTTRKAGNQSLGFTAPDWLVVIYALLLAGLQFRGSDLTNVMRNTVVFALDILVPYFAFSRAITNISDLRKALVAVVIAALPLALIALVETTKSWHLYAGIAVAWRPSFPYFDFVRRSGVLRAITTAGDPITFGFVMMAAVGCLLAVWQRSRRWQGYAWVAMIMLAVGLATSLSRGPWLGTLILVLVHSATGPHAARKMAKLTLISSAVSVVLLLSPFSEAVINILPFFGSVDEATVTYRQRLLQSGYEVLEQNLMLGSSDYLSTPEMKALVQGEGIIDTVNSYLQVALNSGLIGLGLFLGFFVTILIALRQVAKLDANRDVSRCAGALTATLLAILVTIATVSSVYFIPYIYWTFAGLSVALVRISRRERARPSRTLHLSRRRESGHSVEDRTQLYIPSD
jgi:O-Antigen ligase